MPRIIYVRHDGIVHACDVPVGSSVMTGAVDNGVPGIDGDCGGGCACGTCHVHVDPAWIERVGARTPREEEMLSFADGVDGNSRLCCQITVSEVLDGLTVHLPAGQH